MSLKSGLGPGLEIEYNTSSRILQDYIELNWPETTSASYPTLPIKSGIDWGATPDRTRLPVTLRTYTVFSNMVNADIGGNFFSFDIPVAIDIYVRDLNASAERREPTVLVAIRGYLIDFISTNRLGLRGKGINYMEISNVELVEDKQEDEEDVVWYHLVVTTRMYYKMYKSS